MDDCLAWYQCKKGYIMKIIIAIKKSSFIVLQEDGTAAYHSRCIILVFTINLFTEKIFGD